jgi:hypothetical protein
MLLGVLTPAGYNAVDAQVNAVCITRTFAYVCWLLRDSSATSVKVCDVTLDGGPNSF